MRSLFESRLDATSELPLARGATSVLNVQASERNST